MKVRRGFKIDGEDLDILSFADDVVLIADDPTDNSRSIERTKRSYQQHRAIYQYQQDKVDEEFTMPKL